MARASTSQFLDRRDVTVLDQEVKNSPAKLQKAAEQITAEINGVQSVSGEVVNALEAIRHSVETMRNHVVITVAAVEEQSALSRDMSSNMQHAAQASATITENVAGISSAITQVAGAVATTREAAKLLAR